MTTITTMATNITEAKKTLRQQMIAQREASRPDDCTSWSRQIVSQLVDLISPGDLLASQIAPQLPLTSPQAPQPRLIALYRAMRQEADLSAALPMLVKAGFQLAFPRIDATTKPSRLQFWSLPMLPADSAASQPTALHTSDPFDSFFVPGPFGLQEPNPKLTTLCIPDIILLPGLAFDHQGNRLGWGKGYYDRYLAAVPANAQRPLLIGIALPFQLVLEVPTNENDISVDFVLTPSGLIKAQSSLR